MTAISSSPAIAAAPAQARRPPWGVFASIGFVAVGWVVRGPLLAYAPLHALVQAAHHNFFSFSALNIVIQTASFLVIAAAVWLKRWPLAEYLNFAKPRAKDVALGIVVVLAWYLLQNGYYHFAFGKGFGLVPYRAALAAGTPAWSYLLWAWPAVVCAPIVEESAFRGFLWRGIEFRMGRSAALLITSICFTVVHFPAFADFGHRTVVFNSLAVYVVMALILGWLRWRSGSIVVTTVAHTFSNLSIVVAPALITAFSA
jgi:uncharacterized protein